MTTFWYVTCVCVLRVAVASCQGWAAGYYHEVQSEIRITKIHTVAPGVVLSVSGSRETMDCLTI
jgi:hypothetical protein